MQIRTRWCAAIFALLAIVPWSLASVGGPPPPLNPKTYTSPSVKYALNVDPSNPQGAGPSTATMSIDGKPVWTKELDFTIWNAVVGDDGQTVGYAYSWGEDGWGYSVQDLPKENVLWIIRLDADGNVITKDARPREDTRSFTCAPTYTPRVAGFEMLDDLDMFVVRTIGQGRGGPEDWWVYRASTGERIRDAHVTEPPRKDPFFTMIYYARPVPGIPALLVLWEISPYRAEGSAGDARLALIDLHGREVWARQLPGENADGVDHDRRTLRTDGTSLFFTSAATGRSFRCFWTLDEHGDVVTDLVAQQVPTLALIAPSAQPSASASLSSATAAPQAIELPILGEVSLADPHAQPSVFGDIFDFSIDERGHIGWVRRTDGAFRFTMMDQNGTVVHDHELGVIDGQRLPRAVWSTGDTWLLFADGLGEAPAGAWWLDAATGRVTPLEHLDKARLEAATPLADGGFVAFAGPREGEYSPIRSLSSFDAAGNERWSVEYSVPQDILVTPTGEIAVLDAGYRPIRFYTVDGRPSRTIDMKRALGKEPNYPTGLDNDLDGGLILHDFNGHPPVYRLDGEGKIRATLDPKYPDGGTFRLMGHVQVAPNGSLWTSDGVAFLRLDEQGTVAQVVGDKPADRPLTRISGFTIGPNGNLYAVNGTNTALHVFAPDGKPIAVHHPDPTEVSPQAYFTSVAAAPDGSVYYTPGGSPAFNAKGGYLHLAPDGARIGWDSLVLGEVSERWLFHPNSDRRWALGYETLALVEADGSVARRIDRRPGGDWISRVGEGSVAPDGSLAVIAADASTGYAAPAALCIYGSTGDPVQKITLPGELGDARIAFAPPFIVLVGYSDVVLYDIRNPGAPRVISVPRDAQGNHGFWDAYATPDAKQVLLRQANGAHLIRLALPEP